MAESENAKPSSDPALEELNDPGSEVFQFSTAQLRKRIEIFDGNVKFHRDEKAILEQNLKDIEKEIQAGNEKLKRQKTLPYLVATVVEILKDLQEDGENNEAAAYDFAEQKEPAVVIKTASRQTIFLPVPGLLDPEEMSPSDLVGVNKDSFLILDKLPAEYDTRAKAMELEEKPDVNFNDIGGLEKQIEELTEAIVLPLEEPELFTNIGIQSPKGVLLHGPPGTGKTLLARAVANACNACFLKLAGPQLVQMYIGDGAKIIRDAFEIAKNKSPAIVFIDELDAVGTKRYSGDGKGDREVQRTMLELLNQLDGFEQNTQVKVVCATNRPDILDPALLRSGRIDRKVECPLPNEPARMRILKLHATRMNYDKETNFEELARMTQDFNGAQLKAVAVEAGMLALRREAAIIDHEDFVEGVAAVRSKKKTTLNYYA